MRERSWFGLRFEDEERSPLPHGRGSFGQAPRFLGIHDTLHPAASDPFARVCYDARMTQVWWMWIIVGYLLGSIPFGLLIAQARGVDIRKVGSGNIGATNVGRVLGKKWGLLCFFLDVLKGAVPVLIAGFFMGFLGQVDLHPIESWRWLAVAGAAMAGHIFPVWLGFKGGKGVATGLGAVLGFWPMLTLPGLVAAYLWLLLASTFRYVSVASITAALLVPIFFAVSAAALGMSREGARPFAFVTLAMAILVLLTHRANLQRLRAGTESRLGARKA